MRYPKVNILILNWNGEDILCDCLESVFDSDYCNYEVTVIDNGSIDSSINMVKDEFSKVNFILIEKNLGYSKAYNYAFKELKESDSDYYFLLNNDTIINKDTISKLIIASFQYGENNIYGPKIINSNNNLIWYAGGKINYFTFTPYHVGINNTNDITEFKLSNTEFISGCSMLVKKNIIDKLDGFNDSYEFYYEDVDLCLRAKLLESNCIYVNNSSIYHTISFSMGGRYSIKKMYHKISSKIKFIYYNNSFIFSLLYLFSNIILFPFFILTKISKFLYR